MAFTASPFVAQERAATVPGRPPRVNFWDTLVCNEAAIRAEGARTAPSRDPAPHRRGGGGPAHFRRACADDRLRDRGARGCPAAHGLRALPRRTHVVPGVLRALARPA